MSPMRELAELERRSGAAPPHFRMTIDSRDIANPRSGPHPSITHVETKLAWRMRQLGLTSADVVINHSAHAEEGTRAQWPLGLSFPKVRA
ncbi:hypothetical protein DP939_09340 [Spongiactinospora rosea]|uniref:Uncharacterized protein n=1 Tax=Spongiactinospora rosea TaxID=2248750 RepID=A0A366M1G5_9ACTN|nr:hypothetical protein DP939_09340 [Spongiactinospora rosea]